MPSPNALAGYLCRYPLVAAVSYSSEVQQVIKIYDQIDVHETATKLNAFFTSSSFVVNKSTKPQYGWLLLRGSGRLLRPITINLNKGSFSMFTSYHRGEKERTFIALATNSNVEL